MSCPLLTPVKGIVESSIERPTRCLLAAAAEPRSTLTLMGGSDTLGKTAITSLPSKHRNVDGGQFNERLSTDTCTYSVVQHNDDCYADKSCFQCCPIPMTKRPRRCDWELDLSPPGET